MANMQRTLQAWIGDDGDGALNVTGTHDVRAARAAAERFVESGDYEEETPADQLLAQDPVAWWARIEPANDDEEFCHRAAEGDPEAVPMLTWHPGAAVSAGQNPTAVKEG